MRRAAVAAGLAGPTVLAFFSGGYFDEPRVWAGLVAWVLVVVGLLIRSPHAAWGRAGWAAIAGLAGLAAWTLLSITWAPIAGAAYHQGQIVVLYLGALIAAALLLGDRTLRRAVEPALAGGAVIVIGYGLSERLLPGLLHFARSASADGRLEQPLTYWNAMGELAALGFVLCARIAGSADRQWGLRALAAGAAVPLGLGLYLSFSRGALFACLSGLVALAVLAPRREQLRALAIAVLGAVVVSAVASPSAAVTGLRGALATRERQGAITLAALVVLGLAAAAVQWRAARREQPGPLRLPRHSGWIALAAICAGLTLAIVVGAKEKSGTKLSAGATRLAELQSNRYAYWSVALRAFRDQPVRGVGAGGWSVWWLRYRTVNEFATDAHSLPLQVAAELGVVGLALLAVFLAGIALAARAALGLRPALAAGPLAALVAYIAHAPLDWDWQMSAVTLVAVVLAGMVLSIPERRDGELAAPQPERLRPEQRDHTLEQRV